MNKIYEKARHYINMVVENRAPAFVWQSEGGMSKSYTVETVLNERLGENWGFVGGYLTPLQLYKELFKHKDKEVIFFDDVENLLADKNTTAILKGALWSTKDERVVEYRSSSSQLKGYPSHFKIKARIIMCVNRIPKKNNADMKALLSRSMFYNMKVPLRTVKEIILEVAPNLKVGTLESREFMANYLVGKLTVATENVNLRTLVKAVSIYEYNNSTTVWKPLVDELIPINRELEYVHKLMGIKNMKAHEKASEFSKAFGKSKNTYYRHMKTIKQKLLISDNVSSQIPVMNYA